MRYYAKQLYRDNTNLAVGEDFAIREVKYRIVEQLVEKLPFEIKRGALDDPEIISIELDVDITPWKEFVEMIKSYKNKEDLNNQ